MTTAAFAAFARTVVGDEQLHERLLAEPDRQRAAHLVVAAARELGYDVDADDVATATTAARRAWLERWV